MDYFRLRYLCIIALLIATSMMTGCEINDPTASISSNASASVISGSQVTLTWSCENADSCTIDQGIGQVSMSGTINVWPTQTINYTITAEKNGATATDSVTVNVYPVIVSFTATPQEISIGESVTFSWETQGAVACSILPTPGSVGLSGTYQESPTEDTTYFLSCANSVGDAIQSGKIVKVIQKRLMTTEFEYDGAGRIKSLNINQAQ